MNPPTRILAVDTTGEHGSIALAEDARLIEEVALASSNGFAHVLFGALEQLLARHGLDWKTIDVFASASGPGAFTGVRIGLAAVKGLAEAAGRKVIPVSNLQALAWFGTGPLRATLIDARRGDIFGAVYGDTLDLLCPAVVMPLDAWLATLPAGDLEFISAGVALPPGVGPVPETPRLLAGAIAGIAASRLHLALDPAAVDANYVRRSDAELRWKD
jgi:tRNA threonylcarbamoyladenosine biosynthesis protein TsaB